MTDKELEKRYRKVHFKKMSFLGKIAHCLFIHRRKILDFENIGDGRCRVEYEDKMMFWNPLTYIVIFIVFLAKSIDTLIEVIEESKNGGKYTVGVDIKKLMDDVKNG